MKQNKVAKINTITKMLKYGPSYNDTNTVMFSILPLNGHFSIWCPK